MAAIRRVELVGGPRDGDRVDWPAGAIRYRVVLDPKVRGSEDDLASPYRTEAGTTVTRFFGTYEYDESRGVGVWIGEGR